MTPTLSPLSPLSPTSPTDSTHGHRQAWVDEFPSAPDKSDNAEIWRTYVDKADEYDGALIRRWNEGMDVFLLFTGLYSAILSAFLIASWSNLQPDINQATVDALTVLSQQLAASAGGSSPSPYEQSPFTPPVSAIVVNALWFASLCVSLFAAIGAMLVKEWLSAYTQNVALVPVERAQQRQFRYSGLHKWGVPTIVSFLPISIHLAVFLFFTGLVVFTWPVSWPLSLLLLALLAAGVAFYIAASVAPVFYPDCPYKSPLYPALQFVWINTRVFAYRLARHVKPFVRRRDEEALASAGHPFTEYSDILERRHIEEKTVTLQSQALGWLVNSTDHAAQAEALHFLAWWRMPSPVWVAIEGAVQVAAAAFLRRRLTSILKDAERQVSREELEWLALISTHTAREESIVPPDLLEQVTTQLRSKAARHTYHDALITVLGTNSGEHVTVLQVAASRYRLNTFFFCAILERHNITGRQADHATLLSALRTLHELAQLVTEESVPSRFLHKYLQVLLDTFRAGSTTADSNTAVDSAEWKPKYPAGAANPGPLLVQALCLLCPRGGLDLTLNWLYNNHYIAPIRRSLLLCLTLNSGLLNHVQRIELISALSAWGLGAVRDSHADALSADDTKTVLARALLTTCALLNQGGGMQLSRLLEILRYVIAAGISGNTLEEPLLLCLNQSVSLDPSLIMTFLRDGSLKRLIASIQDARDPFCLAAITIASAACEPVWDNDMDEAEEEVAMLLVRSGWMPAMAKYGMDYIFEHYRKISDTRHFERMRTTLGDCIEILSYLRYADVEEHRLMDRYAARCGRRSPERMARKNSLF